MFLICGCGLARSNVSTPRFTMPKKKAQFRKTPPSVLLKFWRSHAWTVSGPGPGRLPLSLSRRLPRPKIFQQVHLQTPSLKRQITSEAFGLSSYTPGRACAGASLCTGPRRRDAGSPMWLPLSVSPRAPLRSPPKAQQAK